MLTKPLQILFITLVVIVISSFSRNEKPRYSIFFEKDDSKSSSIEEMSVEDVLLLIGDEPPIHFIAKVNQDSARMGKEMVYNGKLLDGSNKRLSKYFVCTDCHNQVMESANPANESPEEVLKYGMKNKIPFLPASTFYGMYNKRHWYNGDYSKKYGDLVIPTRDTLYNAIQLCAVQCSQGRKLEHWEIRCILHYYKTLEYKISDLVFINQAEIDTLEEVLVTDKKWALNIIRSKYNEINNAHFGTSEVSETRGYSPNMERGEYIYEYGCLHCHETGKNITNFDLGKDKLSLKFLANKKDKFNHFSIPHITRYGTHAIVGRRQYMPQYTLENLSDKQMLDLLYYVETKAKE